jgi:hypothetical protein
LFESRHKSKFVYMKLQSADADLFAGS